MKIDLDNISALDQQKLFDICYQSGVTAEEFLISAIKDLLLFDNGPSAQILKGAKDAQHIKPSFAEWCVATGRQQFASNLIKDYESVTHKIATWQSPSDFDLVDEQHVAHDALADFEDIVRMYCESESVEIDISDAMLDIKHYNRQLEAFFK